MSDPKQSSDPKRVAASPDPNTDKPKKKHSKSSSSSSSSSSAKKSSATERVVAHSATSETPAVDGLTPFVVVQSPPQVVYRDAPTPVSQESSTSRQKSLLPPPPGFQPIAPGQEGLSASAASDVEAIVGRSLQALLGPGGRLFQSLAQAVASAVGPPTPEVRPQSIESQPPILVPADGCQIHASPDNREVTHPALSLAPAASARDEGDSDASPLPMETDSALEEELPPDATALSGSSSGGTSSRAGNMIEIMNLAQQLDTGLTRTVSTGTGSTHKTSAGLLLPSPSERARNEFLPAQDLSHSVEKAFRQLKGSGEEARKPLDPPRRGAARVTNPSQRACLGGHFVSFDRVSQRPLESDLPPHLLPAAQARSLPKQDSSRLEFQETSAISGLEVYSVLDSLVALLYQVLFDTTGNFRDDTSPDQVKQVLRGFLSTIGSIRDNSATSLALSVYWRRQEMLSRSLVPEAMRLALASAPYDPHGLFGQEAIAQVTAECQQSGVSTLLSSLATSHRTFAPRGSRGSASSTRGSGSGASRGHQASGSATRGAVRRRAPSQSRGASAPKRGRGSHHRGGHPQ